MKKLFSLLAIAALIVAPVFAVAATTSVQAESSYDWDWDYNSSSDDDDGFLAGMSLVTFCCIGCVPLLIWLGVTFLIYKDAAKNNVDNPILWALLVFFFSWIGLLLYFLVGKKK